MDEQAQKEGEARVQVLLIRPLELLGLTKPAGLTKVEFQAMKAELQQRLAYMTADGLGALAIDMEGRGGGPQQDRFPIAGRVLERARLIEQPVADASPLMRKVFASATGEVALRDGYAPDLMLWLRKNRKWPTTYVIGKLREVARDRIRKADGLERDIAAGREVSRADHAWLHARRAEGKRCHQARSLGLGQSEGVSA